MFYGQAAKDLTAGQVFTWCHLSGNTVDWQRPVTEDDISS